MRLCPCKRDIEWKLGLPGASCTETCTGFAGRKCAGNQEWPGWPESPEEVQLVAARAGLVCTNTKEMCDFEEVPLVSEGGTCGWCNTTGTYRARFMPSCDNKFVGRARLCPCERRGDVIPGVSTEDLEEENTQAASPEDSSEPESTKLSRDAEEEEETDDDEDEEEVEQDPDSPKEEQDPEESEEKGNDSPQDADSELDLN